VLVLLVAAAGGDGGHGICTHNRCKSINKTKYLVILGIHKSIKTEFIIQLNEDKMGNACCR
jgi:hypothetical protein